MQNAATWTLTLILTLLYAAIFVPVFRRLLGMQVGRLRCYVVALVIVGLTAPIGTAMLHSAGFDNPEDLTDNLGMSLIILALALLWTLTAGLAALVVLESITPTGSVPSPLAMVRGTRAAMRRSRRYRQLGWILVTSGLSSALRRGPGDPTFDTALVRTLERSGVTFVKLGQILSSRPDLVPTSTANALAALQANVTAVPTGPIRAQLTSAWKRPVEEVLDDFDDQPMAAASVAQVHSASLDSEPVVVKVQRPDARRQVQVDSDILLRFTRTAEARFDWARAMGIADLGSGLTKVLAEEVDYRIESSNTQAIRQALAEHPSIVIPRVFDELSTSQILVMSRLDGRTASSAIESLPLAERASLARTLLRATLDSILVHGVFHADLHPGNILLLEDGRLGLLDFGAIGVIDSESRTLLAALLAAMASDDSVAAASALRMVLDVDEDIDERALRRDLGRTMTLMRHSSRLGSGTAGELFSLLRTYRISVPGDIAGALRTLMSLETTLQAFDPSLTLLGGAQEVMPSLLGWLAAPERLGAQLLVEQLVAASVARRLPERVESTSRKLADGSLFAQANPLHDPQDRAWIRNVVDDGISALFACVLAIASILLLTANERPVLAEGLTTGVALAAALGAGALVLALRLLVRLFTRRQDAAHRRGGA
ncbi:ABC1 kinase family protein [Cumulibacter soli]|uniref:ABC1 kinase family protein n=1 Tax=Cumulibacter soli TaxID=2546344 RepID=UPI0014194DA9|nr:AarF/ABC1/UbiB kinase family protein [Cumulibacter soli]